MQDGVSKYVRQTLLRLDLELSMPRVVRKTWLRQVVRTSGGDISEVKNSWSKLDFMLGKCLVGLSVPAIAGVSLNICSVESVIEMMSRFSKGLGGRTLFAKVGLSFVLPRFSPHRRPH